MGNGKLNLCCNIQSRYDEEGKHIPERFQQNWWSPPRLESRVQDGPRRRDRNTLKSLPEGAACARVQLLCIRNACILCMLAWEGSALVTTVLLVSHPCAEPQVSIIRVWGQCFRELQSLRLPWSEWGLGVINKHWARNHRDGALEPSQ